MNLNYNLLSKHRAKLMGFAILSILLLHFCQDVALFSIHMSYVNRFSHIYLRFFSSFGVDIFIIVSAIGIYYSWNKCKNIKDYFIKRINRVVIPYFIIAIPYFIVINFILHNNTFDYFIKDLFFISFFESGNTIFWYIFAITIFYLLFPLLNKIINESNKGKIYLIIMLIIDVVINYLLFKYNNIEYNKIVLFLVRIPTMLIGTFIAKKVYDKEEVSKNTVLFLVLSFFIVNFMFVYDFKYIIHNFFFSRYLTIILAIIIMSSLTLLLEYLDNKKMDRVLSFFGKYTLELYMFHVAFRHIIVGEIGFKLFRLRYALIFVIVMIIISVLFSKAYSKVKFKKD